MEEEGWWADFVQAAKIARRALEPRGAKAGRGKLTFSKSSPTVSPSQLAGRLQNPCDSFVFCAPLFCLCLFASTAFA
jgi:hypothetical protein